MFYDNHFLFTRHIDVTLVSASLSHKRHVSNFGQCFMSGFKKKTFSLKANNSNFEQLCNAGCVIVEKRRRLLRGGCILLKIGIWVAMSGTIKIPMNREIRIELDILQPKSFSIGMRYSTSSQVKRNLSATLAEVRKLNVKLVL